MNRRQRMQSLPPGPDVPALVNLVGLWKRPTGYLERLRARYGKRFTLQLPFSPPFVFLSDPDEIKQLFTAAPDAVHPGEGARVLESILGPYSVILLDEAEHLEQRRLLLPAFHGEKMQRLTGLMTELTEREVDGWPVDEPVALHPRLQRLTLEIILRAVFGLDSGPRLDALRTTLTDLLEFSESPISVLPPVQRVVQHFGRYRRFGELTAEIDRLIFEQIGARRAGDGAERDDVLSMLVEAEHEDRTPMSEQEIRDELMTALVAGHETTASQLGWTFERLARAPEVTQRLTEEVDGGESDEYLMATIHEVMRLRPVLPNAEPRLTMRPVTIGDFDYPAGASLMASVYLVHHDPDIYPEPHAFRPERFLGRSPGTYTWIPFGGGRRRCLGASFALQEMKIVLPAVLSRFTLSALSPAAEATGRRSITYSPAAGATVVLRRRARSERTPGAGALATVG